VSSNSSIVRCYTGVKAFFPQRSKRPPWLRDGRIISGEENMSKIDELKAELQSLPSDELAEIFRWLSEKDSEGWDKEIEADSHSGGLDFLVHEAREEKAEGTLKDL
jgi:hypothetical protein